MNSCSCKKQEKDKNKPETMSSPGIAWGQSTLSNVAGKRNSDAAGIVPYDFDYEVKAAKKSQPLKQNPGNEEGAIAFVSRGDTNPTLKSFYPYDRDLEIKLANESKPVGDSHFYSRNWLHVGFMEVQLSSERPLLLHTQQAGSVPGTCCSVAHPDHPFVALVYLLKEADVGSTVYVSIPYLTDKHVMDELCHYAQSVQDGGRDLTINLLLCETDDNKFFINEHFIARRIDILEACEKLNIRSTPMSPGFCHSKAIVSTAGFMSGSYNYTKQARFYNQEHGVLLGPAGAQANTKALQQLQARFDLASPVIYHRFPTPEQAP